MKHFIRLNLSVLMLALLVPLAQAQCLPNPFPLGWLTAQELAGGHTIARHVGKTDAQLVNRLINSPNIQNASTYTDQQTAELAITAGLTGVRVAVNNWANNALHGQRRVDNFVATAIVGRVAYRPASLQNIVNSDRLRTVIEADGHGGCFLLTSFPTMPPAGSSALSEHEVMMGNDAAQKYAALAGYLAGQFADSDLAGLSDDVAVKSSLTHVSAEAHRLVLAQGADFLADPKHDPRLIEDWANRRFGTPDGATRWLAYVLEELSVALDSMSAE
ncbi:RNase A-like domain-containing protein [Maritalea myrionectae]|uniref:RNase A-like domain-containing protein n=1 Tax=Maritalea myrionectae TaxID=454601 RepID=UPI00041A7D74|nr:RNase A-like domain-containing protein [Maritalea myrionectae]